jgi:GTPase SAR1 family protein
LLIGDSNVGKTSIIVRYTENKFEASGISTLGADVKFKFVSFHNIKNIFIEIRKFSPIISKLLFPRIYHMEILLKIILLNV